MEWYQVLTIISSNLVLFIWARRESIERHKELEYWTRGILKSIQSEMEEFHVRLCSIEERNKR